MNTTGVAERDALIHKIDDLEHKGDQITHEVFIELSQNFITPFDREDIHSLTSAIDDVADYLNGSAKDIILYNITTFTEPMRKMAVLIKEGAIELDKAVKDLSDMKNIKAINQSLVKIHSIENQADTVLDNSLADLFANEKDAIELIKMKEVLSMLELATYKCEDAANVIESIVLKNA
jgi:predicted phosphate transport protein (TIGR00153 family)